MTERLISLADKWRNIWDKNDTEVVRIIRNDSLDILVDLSGHTAGNRLSAISRRLAPVQISWLGYPSPTQIPSIDYIICDEVVFPNQVSKLPHGSEKPLIIEGGFHCYRQHAVAKIRQDPPCLKRGYVTFGSFNALAKISSSSFDLWSRVLKAVPNSKLLLKRTPLAEEKLRNKIIKKFADLDIESDKIEFRWDLPSTANHLEQYGEIDIALDTTPYNGTTTTCDALFMGVPVITLLGNQMVSRKSASILHQAELNNLIATTYDEYISISRDLSTDLRYLSDLRKNLPETLKASRLCDASRMATALEDAYFKVTQFAE